MQVANEYLEICKDILCREIFKDTGLATKCHFSYGFPSKSALAQKSRRIGEAWQQNNREAVFINPCLFTENNHLEVLGTLIHELIHIWIGVDKGHLNGFKASMLVVGLVGKPTATIIGNELLERLNGLKFPAMPVIPLDSNKVKKDRARLILLMCECGRKIRLSKAVIEQGGITCNLCDKQFQVV